MFKKHPVNREGSYRSEPNVFLLQVQILKMKGNSRTKERQKLRKKLTKKERRTKKKKKERKKERTCQVKKKPCSSEEKCNNSNSWSRHGQRSWEDAGIKRR